MEKQAIMERMKAKCVFFLFLGTSQVFYKKGSHEWKEVKSEGLLLTVNPEKGKKKKRSKNSQTSVRSNNELRSNQDFLI